MMALQNSLWSKKLAQAGLAGMLLVGLPLCVVLPRILALVLPLAALFAVPLFFSVTRAWRALLNRSFWLALVGFTLFGLLGTLRAPDIASTANSFPGLVLNMFSLCILLVTAPLAATTQQLMRWGTIALALTIVLLGVEYYQNGMPLNTLLASLQGKAVKPLYMLDRTIVISALLLWPVAAYAALRGTKPVYLMGLLVVGCYLSFQTSSQAAALGLVFGIVLYALALLLPRLMLQALCVILPLGLLLAPLVVQGLDHATADYPNFWPAANTAERLDIWTGVAHQINAAPVLGQGFEAIRRIDTVVLGRAYTHPHNGMLQIWLETGLVGAVLAAAALFLLLRFILRKGRPELFSWYAGALGTWATIFCVGYNMWQTWWQAAAMLAFFLFVQMNRAPTAAH